VTMPERYQREPSGGWRCPPGESAAQAHGLYYRVRTNEQVHPLVIQNLKFLQDFLEALDHFRGFLPACLVSLVNRSNLDKG